MTGAQMGQHIEILELCREEEFYGFDNNLYAVDASANYVKGNQYTFDFLKKNKDMIDFWML